MTLAMLMGSRTLGGLAGLFYALATHARTAPLLFMQFMIGWSLAFPVVAGVALISQPTGKCCMFCWESLSASEQHTLPEEDAIALMIREEGLKLRREALDMGKPGCDDKELELKQLILEKGDWLLEIADTFLMVSSTRKHTLQN